MRVIPVIDLMGGDAVGAREGRRESYRPITSILTRATDPGSVIDALLSVYAFSIIYLADLDALTGVGSQWRTIENLARSHPAVSFWVDQGLAVPPGSFGPGNVLSVIGTESVTGPSARSIRDLGPDFVLSLDFLEDRLIGDDSWLRQHDDWPSRIIVMSLSHVGAASGPDFVRLRQFRRRYPRQCIVAAGGIRDAADLQALAEMGIGAALVATALHNGAIGAEALCRLDCG